MLCKRRRFFTDTFSYADGDLTVYDGTGDDVSGGAWVPYSGTTFPPPIEVAGGNAVLLQGDPASEDANRDTGQVIAGGTWYYGALITVNDKRTDPDTQTFQDGNEIHFIGLSDGGTNDLRSRTVLRDGSNSSTYSLAIAPTSFDDAPDNGISANWATDLVFGRQYKIMASYTVETGESKLWVDPTDENSTSVSLTSGAAALEPVSHVYLRQDFINDTSPNPAAAEILVNAVAVGDEFGDVMRDVMIPEPTSGLLAVIGMMGIVASRRRIA